MEPAIARSEWHLDRQIGRANVGVSAALFDSSTRLYRLDAEGELTGLQVEAFVLEEALSQPWRMDLCVLHERADLDLDSMLAQQVTLVTVLADGREHRRTGMVAQVVCEDSDGGLARYRLTLQPWLGFLSQSFRSFIWQERHVNFIIDSVLERFATRGSWRWSPCVGQWLADAHEGGVRSYCVQYRENDLDFVGRILAEEGIGYRFEEAAAGAPGPTVVFFADSTSSESIPEDAASASAAGGPGIRFHADGVQEAQDTVQAFGGVRGQPIAVVTAVSYDYKTGRMVGAEVPTLGSVGGNRALHVEAYDTTQGYAYASQAQAERAMRLKQQALECRHKCWVGRGVVRSFTAGNRFTLAESMLDMIDAFNPSQEKRFLLTGVTHVGVNNLPKELNASLIRKDVEGGVGVLPPWIELDLRAQAAARGYANSFEAIRTRIPWRPLRTDETGTRFNPKPRVPGPLDATVVGPDGSTRPQGNQEVYTDRLGRVLIRYEFQNAEQDDTRACALASTWVRVLQPLAGDGTGMWWIPRIGHEVLVGFYDDDIDRPYVICSLYNGRGEGGESPTPGGRQGTPADASVFAQSSDARPSGQGNLTGGHSPAWHGASPGEIEHGGQRNAAALSGYKTKEFGGEGFNQLVFDDSTAQLRVQLATTQHATQLNLGHLIHQADNHRGSFRGLGFELRTDAYGAIRGAGGVLLSTYDAQPSDPAGDNAAGIAMARQWKTLAEAFSSAAEIHQTVALSGVIGTSGGNQSALDEKASPIAAWLTQTRGMVAAEGFDAAQADAGNKSTPTQDGKVPHGTDAVIDVSARGGLAMVSGQDAVFASEENVQIGSGQNIDVAAGGALRLHTGQAIGILGGAIKPGDEAAGTGLTMIAGAGDIDLQAQAGTLQVAALTDVVLQSERAGIDLAAAKKITLSTAGGASITIEGGNITFACPGTITIHAGTKSFVGAERVSHTMPSLPAAPLPPEVPSQLDLRLAEIAGPPGGPRRQASWRIVEAMNEMTARTAMQHLFSGKSDAQGRVSLTSEQADQLRRAYDLRPGRLWLTCRGKAHQLRLTAISEDWADATQRAHALDAYGYADTLGIAGNDAADGMVHAVSRLDTEASTGAATLAKLKG